MKSHPSEPRSVSGAETAKPETPNPQPPVCTGVLPGLRCLVAGIQARTEHSFRWGLLLALLGALGFSAKAILVKLAYIANPGLQPITLMALRMAIAVPLFLLIAWVLTRGRAPRETLSRHDLLMLIVLGLFGYYLASLFDFWGLQYISAGLERLVLYLYPSLVVLMLAGLEHRPVPRSSVQAMLLGYAGIALLMFNDVQLVGEGVFVGSLLVFVSALCFAVFLVGNGVLIQRLGNLRFTTWTMSFAGLFVGLHFATLHDVGELLAQPARVWQLALVMAIFSTVVPAFLLNAGIRRVGAGAASLVSTIGPVSTLFLAAIFLDEPITALQLAGTGLVLLGVSRLRG